MKKLLLFVLVSLFAVNYAHAQFEGQSCTVRGTSSQVMIKKIDVNKRGKVSVTFTSDANERVNVVLEVKADVKYKYYKYGKVDYITRSSSCTIAGTVDPQSGDWGNTFSDDLEIKSKIGIGGGWGSGDDEQTVYVDDIELTSCRFKETSKCN